MKLKQSKKQNVKLRIGLSGPSGFGKSYSALLLAYGMTKDWSKIAVIDSEQGSSNMYSGLGNFNVLDLNEPYSPSRYIEAIKVCENSGAEVILIDSVSHEWNGTGGCLDIHSSYGGRFQDWSKVTPQHQAFINAILKSKCHIITTTRRKVDYSLDPGTNGRTKVVKHGTKEITREGFEYELALNLELINDKHLVNVSKDRTGLFTGKPEFKITPKIGERLIKWCNATTVSKEDIYEKINSCLSISELTKLYNDYPNYQQTLNAEFRAKKQQLEQLINPQNFSRNGNHTNN